MTDSTDNARGPERIWASPKHLDRWDQSVDCCTKKVFAHDVEYIRADLAPDPLGAVKVKPLVWEEVDWWRHIGRPPVKFADFAMWVHQAGKTKGWQLSNKPEIYETLEAAKAAAQANYETRIRSALEPCDPLVDPRVVALVEALRKGLDAIDDLNTLEPDENGHRWRESDLLDQEVMALRAARAALSPTGGNDE